MSRRFQAGWRWTAGVLAAGRVSCALLVPGGLAAAETARESPSVRFLQGITNYQRGDFTNAAACFRAAADQSLAPGAYCNLGNAEWLAGRTGHAVLAWERARWIDPFQETARDNLDFARKMAHLDAPEPAWSELCSAWLPTAWWPWLAMGFFWCAVAGWILPLRSNKAKTDWRQGVTAAGFAGFLLVLPALAGIHERAKLGVVLDAPAPLRLAPAPHAQAIATLRAGERVRRERREGGYYLVRASSDATGWVATDQVAWIAGQP
jgi:hypothetical protein